eukprot:1777951-Amphidinium_carterae.1
MVRDGVVAAGAECVGGCLVENRAMWSNEETMHLGCCPRHARPTRSRTDSAAQSVLPAARTSGPIGHAHRGVSFVFIQRTV